jgi:hypothetical protein
MVIGGNPYWVGQTPWSMSAKVVWSMSQFGKPKARRKARASTKGDGVPVDMVGVFAVFGAVDATDTIDSCDPFGSIDVLGAGAGADADVDLGKDGRIPARSFARRTRDC